MDSGGQIGFFNFPALRDLQQTLFRGGDSLFYLANASALPSMDEAW